MFVNLQPENEQIMAEDITIIPNQAELEAQFAFVNSVIERYRSSAIAMVNTAALQMNWEIGQYISMQLKSSKWGAKVVGDLADYLKRQNPRRRGLSKRNLYNMVKFLGTIYLLSPGYALSLKATELSNRGWNVVTPSDIMLSIILAESEHLVALQGARLQRHPRLLKLSPSATTFYTVNKHILSTRGQQVYSFLM